MFVWCCALTALCWPLIVHAQTDGSTLPDNLEAANAEMDENGVVHADGGASITISSMIAGATVQVDADSVEYDTRSGAADMYGNVRIAVAEYGFELECERFNYDPLMQRMEVGGLKLALPLGALNPGQDGLFASRLSSAKHFYNFNPQTVYAAAGAAHFDFSADSAGVADFVLEDVKLSPSAREDGDFYVTAREARVTQDDRVLLKGIALHISGLSLGEYPQLSKSLHPQPGWYSLDIPKFGFIRDGAFSIKERAGFTFDPVKVDALLDYATDRGMRARAYTYIEPLPGMTLGVALGSRSMDDYLRRTYVLTEDYNAILRQRFKQHGAVVEDAWYSIEYGRLSASPEDTAPPGQASLHVKDTREAAEATVKFALIPLGGDLYLATGVAGRYIVYRSAKEEYRVIGAEAGLVYDDGGFEQFVLYTQNLADGKPVFAMDEVRDRQLSFATSIRLHPEWRHVIRGVYDIDREEFDKLQIGAMKKQKDYEIGLYWDVTNNNPGIEIGLLTN